MAWHGVFRMSLLLLMCCVSTPSRFSSSKQEVSAKLKNAPEGERTHVHGCTSSRHVMDGWTRAARCHVTDACVPCHAMWISAGAERDAFYAEKKAALAALEVAEAMAKTEEAATQPQ